ncbi:MAG TPA: CFI-box-CTERM domain-containing protein [Dehalococcoidia bacterium]|nr:CFI-box-CTERM domain-containing protein [Dehalococcoidia bacterium]
MNRHIRVMLVTLLVVTGVLVLLPSGYVGAGGLVVNGGFELEEGGVPYGWNLTGSATGNDTGPIYEGNWVAQITGENDTLTQWVYIGNGTSLIPGISLPITYNAWGWIYVSGNVTGVIAFDFWAFVGNGTFEENETVQLSPTTTLAANDTNGQYVQMTTTMQSVPGATYLRVRLLGTGWNEGAEVRFDEIGVYPVTGYCFIATAAYGTETASQLNILREFRDQVLLKNPLGSLFVATYYKLSPPLAAFIAKDDFLRAIVRDVLVDPAVHLLQWSQGLWRASPDIP